MNNVQILLAALFFSCFAPAMEKQSVIDLNKPSVVKNITRYIMNVRRCDRSQAECYLADLTNGEVLECWEYYQSRTIICTHSTSHVDQNKHIINERYFSILKKISENKIHH